jgi:serine/threonine protein phosphatase 1
MVRKRLPADTRIYAVGDVHGHSGKLAAMHAAIRADLRRDPVARPLLIHLGDYIDRGPDSAGCLAQLSAGSPIAGAETVNLMGNHEWMFLQALEGQTPGAAALWFENGGVSTLASWGIPAETPPAQWSERIPPPHLAFLRGLLLSHLKGGFIFVHAGVRPRVAWAAQDPFDLLWIRWPFLDWDGPMLPDQPDSIVVHGHTPAEAPEVRPNRVGIDTNAGRGGPLTCCVLGAEQGRFIQV